MIRSVSITRFKRFANEVFPLEGNVVLAGHNNSGKTTALQAIAAWALAIRLWRENFDLYRHNNAYARAPVGRDAFTAVPVRDFDLLWHGRVNREPMEISVTLATGQTFAMEFIPDTREQIYVRPKSAVPPELAKDFLPDVVFVPPMSGISVRENVVQPPFIQLMLGLGKPGDVVRNLLVQVAQSEAAWQSLCQGIRRIFGYVLAPPNATGPYIVAEYQECDDGPRLDLASAGSGFQQVLSLLTFLHTRTRGSVLLVDEPDAHLHFMLQDTIYGELGRIAAKSGSQLIIATHSEVIIDSVQPAQICVLHPRPHRLDRIEERDRWSGSLGILTNTDLVQASQATGVLYTEGHTDLALLRAWSKVLDHPVKGFLESQSLLWKPLLWERREGAPGIKASDHYQAVQLIRPDIPALILIDGDGRSRAPNTPLTGQGLQRLSWRRYEIESYLFHPQAIARFVEKMLGANPANTEALHAYLRDAFPAAMIARPLEDHPWLLDTKARTNLLPPILSAAGVHGLEYTEYHRIAEAMLPEEIHPEVREKLDAIVQAFRL